MWSVWLVFCDCGFHSVCPLMEKDKRLMEASCWERLTDSWVLFWWAGLCSVNLQSNFLLIGGAVFAPCYLASDQTMVEVMQTMTTCFKRSHAGTATLSGPDPAAGDSQASLGQSLVASLLHCSVCALQESVSSGLRKFCKSCISPMWGSPKHCLIALMIRKNIVIPHCVSP